jgi:uncharacterized membrane protein
MSPVYIVALLALVFRLLGLWGIAPLDSWVVAIRSATGITFIIMGAAHFTPIRHDVERLVPRSLRRPALVVLILGVWQIAGGVGILTPQARRVACIALLALLILKLPANVRAARQSLRLKGRLATAPAWRVPAQLMWIALVWWTGS